VEPIDLAVERRNFQAMESIQLGIIGTAGRQDDAARLSETLYLEMLDKALKTIMDLYKRGYQTVGLVSGGAAWADHCAVTLFLQGRIGGLKLCLPAPFDLQYARGSKDGAVANRYHNQFTEVVGFDSLAEIEKAIHMPGCSVLLGRGFKDRNRIVAEFSDAVLAMTFGNGRALKPKSGTADTMAEYKKRHTALDLSYHMDLNTLACWRQAA